MKYRLLLLALLPVAMFSLQRAPDHNSVAVSEETVPVPERLITTTPLKPMLAPLPARKGEVSGSQRPAASRAKARMMTSTDLGQANDDRPPSLILHAGQATQPSYPKETWWIQRQQTGLCVHQSVLYPSAFPPNPPTVSYLSDHVQIFIHKQEKPRSTHLYSWLISTPSGQPLGPRSVVPFTLHSMRTQSGSTVWTVDFVPPNPGDSFLELRADWNDQAGCGGVEGGIWRFTLRSLM